MLKVLIVEDDNSLRQAYDNILSNHGFDVKLAQDGKVGATIALEWNPDVVLLDLLMPEMDGIGFLKAFDALGHPKTKIIVFSNLSLPEKIEEAIQLGAISWQVKAMFTPKEMIDLIKSTAGESASKRTTKLI